MINESLREKTKSAKIIYSLIIFLLENRNVKMLIFRTKKSFMSVFDTILRDKSLPFDSFKKYSSDVVRRVPTL